VRAGRGGRYVPGTMPVTPPPVDTAQHLATHFILHLAKALHAHGYPAHRLEDVLGTVAARLGVEAQFFTTPTSIFAGFGAPDAQRTHLLRVQPGEPNLGHLSRLDAIMSAVVDGRITASDGSVRIGRLLAEPPRWSRPQTLVAFVLASAAVSCFFGVTAVEALVASGLGLVAGLCALMAGQVRGLAPVLEPFTAAIVATLAFLVAGVTGSGNAYQTTLAGLIVLLPGLTFTIGLTELSTRHLASGTARLAGALVTFLGLGFGVALGAKAGSLSAAALAEAGVAWTVTTVRVPAWTEGAAVLVAPLCFAVLLRAERRDAWWILVAGAAAYGTARFAGRAMGEELGAFLGALLVSAGSNLLERWRRVAAMVTQVPGLLILVPGGIGFRSVTSLLGNETVAGIDTAFRVALVGISLAAGILAGNVVTGLAKPEFAERERDG
jgi:uncharacterized membrane protein YjjP (DUF1212 family)